jgi:hypothetical protein
MKTFTRTVLIADDGKMLTDGEIYAKSVELGDWDKAENYHEITTEEYEQIMSESEEVIEA